VVLGGANRDNNRDFTYIHHHQKAWLPDWFPISPVAHAVRNDTIGLWITIRLETLWFRLRQVVGIRDDNTNNSLFYIRHDWPLGWFGKKIKTGEMKNPLQIGNHVFYQFCKKSWKTCDHSHFASR